MHQVETQRTPFPNARHVGSIRPGFLRRVAAATRGRLLLVGVLLAAVAAAAPAPAPALPQDYLMFSINVHDYAYPDLSVATLRRLLAIHERHQVPVDFYLTTTMTDQLLKQAPDLWEQLKKSPLVSICYHVRPPTPYYTRSDWLGLRTMPAAQQRETIRRYETHGLDLVTGQTADQPGGYQKLKDLLGFAPIIVSAQADVESSQAVADVFKELGARIFAVHGRPPNVGDQLHGVPLRPEHVDLKLFEHPGESAGPLIDASVKQARQVNGARPPYFVGVKMHDNDFYALRSAWTTTYVQGRRRPPWDLSLKAPLRPEAERQALWTLYEAAVAHAAKEKARLKTIGARDLLALLQPKAEAANPPALAVETAGLVEVERDALGYSAQTRSYRVCAEAGVRVVNFPAEHSFAALWVPPNYQSGRVLVLLHGSNGTAYDELKDELPAARQHGHLLIALQWLNRETRRYLDAPEVYQLVERALHYAAERHRANLAQVALCGFSRGGAVSYEVAWHDALEHRHFRLVICHSGGVPLNAVVAPGEGWHPDQFFGRLNSGRLGANALQGTSFYLYSGDRDEQWGTRMSEQMAHAQRVLTAAGATVVAWAHDPQGGHMGFRTNAVFHEAALGHFLRLSSQPAGAAAKTKP